MPENRILQALTVEEFAALRPRLTAVDLKQHETLYEAGGAIEHVYFPLSGLMSLLNVSDGRDAIEVGIVSAEGVVGGLVLLDERRSACQVAVQIPGKALRLSTAHFLDACSAIPRLRHLVNLHFQILLFQAQQNATCHALHTVEARLCRWLLYAQDVTKSGVLELTQEFLSNVLGAQRTSISMMAHMLQHAGFIQYSRGRIKIVDKLGLEEAACECHSLVKEAIDARFPEYTNCTSSLLEGRDPISCLVVSAPTHRSVPPAWRAVDDIADP
jgi:CRP-like cAMP-binding protein